MQSLGALNAAQPTSSCHCCGFTGASESLSGCCFSSEFTCFNGSYSYSQKIFFHCLSNSCKQCTQKTLSVSATEGYWGQREAVNVWSFADECMLENENIVLCILMLRQLLSQQAVCKIPLPLNPSCSSERPGWGPFALDLLLSQKRAFLIIWLTEARDNFTGSLNVITVTC